MLTPSKSRNVKDVQLHVIPQILALSIKLAPDLKLGSFRGSGGQKFLDATSGHGLLFFLLGKGLDLTRLIALFCDIYTATCVSFLPHFALSSTIYRNAYP